MRISKNTFISNDNSIHNIKRRNKFNLINNNEEKEDINSVFNNDKKSINDKNYDKTEHKTKTQSKVFTKSDGTKVLLITITSPNGTICSRSIKLSESNGLIDKNSRNEQNSNNVSSDSDSGSANIELQDTAQE